MQYAKIEIADGLKLSCQEIGEELENEMERLGFQVELPSSTDWGYVFRTKNNGQVFDVSIVLLEQNSFGIAVEPEKDFLSEITRYFKKPEIDGVKAWVEEILTTDIGAKSLKWFSADEWCKSFGKGFWNNTHK